MFTAQELLAIGNRINQSVALALMVDNYGKANALAMERDALYSTANVKTAPIT